ncbi:hypothetical protein LCGC14_2969650 [marine sediment metagenome]|uniref:Uncharacterized protein n=1 Tax=marine sediment metagenome TaxID=412755 RepID=A0A0F8ZHK4_9ZZZZ
MTYFRIHHENALKELELLLKSFDRKVEELESEIVILRREQLNLIGEIENNTPPRKVVRRWILEIKKHALERVKNA